MDNFRPPDNYNNTFEHYRGIEIEVELILNRNTNSLKLRIALFNQC